VEKDHGEEVTMATVRGDIAAETPESYTVPGRPTPGAISKGRDEGGGSVSGSPVVGLVATAYCGAVALILSGVAVGVLEPGSSDSECGRAGKLGEPDDGKFGANTAGVELAAPSSPRTSHIVSKLCTYFGAWARSPGLRIMIMHSRLRRSDRGYPREI
jgi:hypothetical protein